MTKKMTDEKGTVVNGYPLLEIAVSCSTSAFGDSRASHREELTKIVQVLAGDIMEGRLKPNVPRALADANGCLVGMALLSHPHTPCVGERDG